MKLLDKISAYFNNRKEKKIANFKSEIKKFCSDWGEKMGRTPLFWRSDCHMAEYGLEERIKHSGLEVEEIEKLLHLLANHRFW